jgi:predicted hotdog family 3-hydroxylacyl-ACP dehydratase
MKTGSVLPLPVTEYVPHRKPMRLVETLLDVTAEDAGIVEARIDDDCLLLQEDKTLLPVSMVELIAQAYAAVKGYSDQTAGLPCRKGFLVGIQKSEFRKPAEKGDRLRIIVETTAVFNNFSVITGRVLRGEEVLGSASIKVFSMEAE